MLKSACLFPQGLEEGLPTDTVSTEEMDLPAIRRIPTPRGADMSIKSIGLLAVVMCCSISFVKEGGDGNAQMVAAAQEFLSTLSVKERAQAVKPFDAADRKAWHFVPKMRPGLCMGDMSDKQRRAVQKLLRSALSQRGYLKATTIMDLERALQEMGGSAKTYSPKLYWITVFGEPSAKKHWGWRLEGHHLSLNFSAVADSSTAVTPWFMGSNPAEIPTGIRAGLKVLGHEEALARSLMASFDSKSLKSAIIKSAAPRDVIMGPDRTKWIKAPVGISNRHMSKIQRATLHALVEEFAGNLRPDLAAEQLARMVNDQPIHFAWAGGLKLGEGHYFRIQGQTFIIEYDNVQQKANHVHTVWRDRDRDFGADLLREHHQHSHR